MQMMTYIRVHHGVAQALIRRSAFHGIADQIAVLGIAFQQPLAFQETSDAARAMVCVRWVSSALVGAFSRRNRGLGPFALAT